jgi:DNA invertase Pin-like site-specific DNA recombinase
MTGTKRDGREKLDLLSKLADKGDTIVISRIDRLARLSHLGRTFEGRPVTDVDLHHEPASGS